MKEKDYFHSYKNLKPNNEMQKSHDFVFNSPKSRKKEQAYVIRKLSERENSEGKITQEIDNYFFNPEKYFSPDSPISIGKKQEIKEISVELKSTKSRRNLLSSMSLSNRRSVIPREKIDHKIDNSKYEVIDNKRLNNIFNSFKELKKNKSYTKNNPNIPKNISLPLNIQNKNILYYKYNNKNNKNLLHFLSKKIHKNEKDLVMNKVDSYLYKKEIVNNLNKNNNINEIRDRYKWITSLRNPEKLNGVKRTLVNINTDKYPFWSFLIEKSQNFQQTTVKPGIDLNNRNFLRFIKKAKSNSDINEENINNLKNLDEISIKGENLFNVEYNREMNSKKKKILHKAFVENGKVVLNTDINNVFGKQTFYKNYDRNKSFLSPNIIKKKSIIYTYSNL